VILVSTTSDIFTSVVALVRNMKLTKLLESKALKMFSNLASVNTTNNADPLL